MGFAGVHVLLMVVILVVLVAAVGGGLYLLVRKAVAAGVRDAQQRGPRD